MTVVSDRKLGVANGGNTGYDYYLPKVVNLYDYYPFGSPMPGRSFVAQECSTVTTTGPNTTVIENYFESCSTTLILTGSNWWVMNTTDVSDCAAMPPR